MKAAMIGKSKLLGDAGWQGVAAKGKVKDNGLSSRSRSSRCHDETTKSVSSPAS